MCWLKAFLKASHFALPTVVFGCTLRAKVWASPGAALFLAFILGSAQGFFASPSWSSPFPVSGAAGLGSAEVSSCAGSTLVWSFFFFLRSFLVASLPTESPCFGSTCGAFRFRDPFGFAWWSPGVSSGFLVSMFHQVQPLVVLVWVHFILWVSRLSRLCFRLQSCIGERGMVRGLIVFGFICVFLPVWVGWAALSLGTSLCSRSSPGFWFRVCPIPRCGCWPLPQLRSLNIPQCKLRPT